MVEIIWFDDGLRFNCKGCGACCKTHGEYAYVFLSDWDVEGCNIVQFDGDAKIFAEEMAKAWGKAQAD